MSALRQALTGYVRMRRGFGYRYISEERCLRSFVAFLEAAGASVITRKLALAWISQIPRKSKPVRLAMVRGFARHLSNLDPRTETIPTGIFPSPKRPRPHIYTQHEIARLLEATLNLAPVKDVNCWTYHCLFGLLAATGMRVGEAISLKRIDVDLETGILTLRDAKHGKDRIVPLDPTTTQALADYASRRDDDCACRKGPWFFVLRRGKRLRHQYVHRTFIAAARRIGLRDPELHSPGPRLHDLRHTFAVNTILRWYRDGGDVERLLPTLSTYLGHSKTRDTYWYLSACPELMGEAVRRLEARWGTAA